MGAAMTADEILNELHFSKLSHDLVGDTHASNDQHVQTARAAFLAAELERIGEDEMPPAETLNSEAKLYASGWVNGRNELRAELRAKARKFWKETP